MRDKILVVDDCREFRELMVDILRRRDYQVSTAQDGYEAVTQFERDIPDLLITDLTMPGMDGYELCRVVRETSSVPIVVITERGMGDRYRAFKAGADMCFPKPFDLVKLLSEVEVLLKVSSPHAVG